MPSPITIAVQQLFFPNYKVPVKLNWRKRLSEKGFHSAERTISRGDGQIKVTILEPSAEMTNRNHTVVLAHPLSRKARHYFGEGEIADLYLAQNYRVVLFDFNGFGESDRIDMFYWKDAEAVIKWVLNEWTVEHLVLHGTSFGAFHIVRAAPALPAGSTLVLENVSRSLYDYWKRWKITGFAAKVLPKLPYQAFRDMEIQSIISSKLQHIEIVFVACTEDQFTPIQEMNDLAKLTDMRCRFLAFECGHLEAHAKFPDDYSKQLKQSLRTP